MNNNHLNKLKDTEKKRNVSYTLIILMVLLASIVKAESPKDYKDDSLKVKIIEIPNDTSVYTPLLSKGDAVSMRSGRLYLLQGESSGEHSTESYEEFIIVLKGSGVLISNDGEQIIFSEGQAIYVPPYYKHNILNKSHAVLIYIYIVAKTNL